MSAVADKDVYGRKVSSKSLGNGHDHYWKLPGVNQVDL